jgi:hypothetical protein
MTCETTRDGMVCKVAPLDSHSQEAFQQRCEALIQMMSTGSPCLMVCGGMPVLIGVVATGGKG